jgi:hypothetical protein
MDFDARVLHFRKRPVSDEVEDSRGDYAPDWKSIACATGYHWKAHSARYRDTDGKLARTTPMDM